MKRAPRSRQRHDLYAKYHDYDSEISDLLGECGFIDLIARRAGRGVGEKPSSSMICSPFANARDAGTCLRLFSVRPHAFRGLPAMPPKLPI
jgi:hypothetical protein